MSEHSGNQNHLSQAEQARIAGIPMHNGNGVSAEIAENAAQKQEQDAGDGKRSLSLEGPKTRNAEFKFSFKKAKKDELGQEVKRAPVKLTLPIPTYAAVVELFLNQEDVSSDTPQGKSIENQINFVLDLIEDAVKDQARLQVYDKEKPVDRQDDLDVSKLSLAYIANIPKSERAGSGISDETWEAFEKDYIEVMLPIKIATDPKGALDKVSRAANILKSKFPYNIRSDKGVLKFLRDNLGMWFNTTENKDDFQEVFDFLDRKATDYIQKDNVDLMSTLV